MICRFIVSFNDFLSKNHWVNVIFTRRTFDNIFSAFGKIWLLITVVSFFSPVAKDSLNQNPYFLVGIIILVSIWVSRPKLSVRSNVRNSDIHIEIQVGNIFDFRGTYVISTNTTFDTDVSSGIISKNSLQGQFASKFYKNKINELDSDLENLLNGLQFEKLNDDRLGKKKRYPLGTVIQLKKSNKGLLKKSKTVFYLVAIANLNKHGSIESISFEDIQESISELWKKIEATGNIDPIVIPLLGSSRCRLKQSRTDFAKVIINSFVLACRNKKICEKLIIVISPQDYRKYAIDLHHLNEYLNCRCTFPELVSYTKE
ncbi:MAG: DUF6430 domain-containing protein [Calothrix sp. MO_192.B10]|nr:DUF6430 domain-containing protein [Calothrix sp. MO_192.B10]